MPPEKILPKQASDVFHRLNFPVEAGKYSASRAEGTLSISTALAGEQRIVPF